MYRRVLLLILVGCFYGSVVAQQVLSISTNPTGSATNGTDKFYYANHNDPPRAIEFKPGTVTVSYFLANINRYLNLPAEFTFIQTESNTDNIGMRHRVLQQYYKGIPLEGMVYRVHEKNGFLTSVNGKAIRNITLNTQTSITEEQAFYRAVQHLHTRDTVFRPAKKLIVSKNFTFTPESFSIAFQFDMDVSLIEKWRISIDARNGQTINKVSLVNSCLQEPVPPLPYGTGTGLTNYYGSRTIQIEKFEDGSSKLVGQTEHGGQIGTYDFGNADPFLWFWGIPVPVYDFYSADTTFNNSYYKPAVSVQWAAEMAYEYYFRKHNRNSFDNNGSMIRSYVHVDRDLNNAFWAGNTMLFGDGSNNNPLVELDVVAHELTHGVTQYEANLQYYNESGALNESFSDIFGKAVEFDTFGDTATWQLAKYYRSGGLRDFSNPNLKNQPDTYQGDLWFTGYEDNGGVHYNSGVQNFWFYLLCEGGNGVNDHEISYSVNSVGMEAAVTIAYRNLTEYLSSNSDYLDTRIGSMLAAADLYGKNSTVYQEVDKAWDAVGVIDEPIINSLEVYDITATTVKLRGSLQPRGDSITYHFEYGTTPAFGSSSSTYPYTSTVEGMLTGLQSQTKYYLRLVATNENGSTFFTSESFTTISLAPLVNIKDAVDVTETTATLRGEVNPNSLSTSFHFEYGPTPALGLVTPSYALSDTTEFLKVSASIINLQSRQTYYYRLVASNGFASPATGSVSFFTAVKPVVSSYTPTTAPIGTEITITGQSFNPVAEMNLVNFGATRGTVLSASPTELKVKVPAGASFGPITVLDAESALAAQSVQEFVPTFTGEFRKNSLQLRVGINEPYIWRSKVQDMDGDNRPDIVAIHYQGFSVYQNVNQGGDITTESFVRNTRNVPDFFSGDFSVIDFDGNGRQDIITRYQEGLRIYPNFSVPGFIFFGVPVELPIGFLDNLMFHDFDMDGRVDIGGITSLDSTRFVVYKNRNPKGTLSAHNFEREYSKVLTYSYLPFLTSGDLNNDGKPDVMAGPYGEATFYILKNVSHPGVLEFEESVIADSTRGRYARYIAHDLNQDSWKDVISHSPYESGNLDIRENKRSSPEITLAAPIVGPRDYVVTTAVPGDINGDGQVDLLAATNQREFIFFKSNVKPGEQLSTSSFENSAKYGMSLVNSGSGSVETQMVVNDLNGDGRPEIINTYYYNFGPHDGYQMEIWQNSADDTCPDPSRVAISVSNNVATIKLPPNTTFDQFEIDYTTSGNNGWYAAHAATLYVSPGFEYQFRIRAKCYLGFTDYYFITFITDCIDASSFSIYSIDANHVFLNAPNLSSLEVQYSQAGKNQWETLYQYSNQITNLSAGTTYDLRFRGRCYLPGAYNYRQFTTLCPTLSSLTFTEITYNKAVVNWTSNQIGNVTLEYSADNATWMLLDETRTMFPLTPGQRYYVRGRFECTDINSDFIYKTLTTPCPKISLVNVDAITPFSAAVNWVDETNTGSYTVTYSQVPGGPGTTVETNSTSVILTGLSPGTQYSVSVAPHCSSIKNFTSTSFRTVCYVPFDLSLESITPTTADLAWNDNFSGAPYSIDYSIVGSNVWQTIETALTTVSLAKLRPGTKYEVRVHINCLSEKAPHVALRFETKLYEETTFAPNPTEGKITLYPSKNLIGSQFSILDNTGRLVSEGEIRTYTVDFSDFPAGMYTLKIHGEKPMRIVKH